MGEVREIRTPTLINEGGYYLREIPDLERITCSCIGHEPCYRTINYTTSLPSSNELVTENSVALNPYAGLVLHNPTDLDKSFQWHYSY